MEPVDWLPEWIAYPLFWIWLNQTLITGFFALAAAVLTVRVIRQQIAQEKVLAEQSLNREEQRITDEISRKHRAARAGLPLALTEIYEYSDACIKRLLQYVANGGHINTDIHFDVEFDQELQKLDRTRPEFPTAALQIIRDTIEYLEFKNAKTMQITIAFAQIQKSRFNSVLDSLHHADQFTPVATTADVFAAIRDALGLQMLTNAAYNFARGKSEDIGTLCSNLDARHKVEVSYYAKEPLARFIEERWPPSSLRELEKSE
ncbi:MAG: hypothetical protein AAGF33_12635 [Pseudomonadota bacterium]